MLDYNLANASGAVIGFEARTPILGFNVPEALLLTNSGRSIYNSIQLGLTKRMSNSVQFNLAYTYSRSKDTSSADPGSTAGGGKPDAPNTGFVVQRDNRNVDANYALSDFDGAPSLQRKLGLEPSGPRPAGRVPLLGIRADAVRSAVLDLLGGAGARQRESVRRLGSRFWWSLSARIRETESVRITG
jgi:hypothetical protein